MQSLRGSCTERNLLQSFAGESQARNRYTYFSSRARKDGFMQIAAIFAETADQEKEHAERFFKFLEGGMLEITGSFPAGVIGSTSANLALAADGEYEEWHRLYPGFAQIAREEGFIAVAEVYDAVCVSERQHEKRYRELLKHVENGTVFKRSQPVVWRCRNCGYLHTGTEAPGTCPACAHSMAYFEINPENW